MILPRHTGNDSSGELLTVAPWAVKKLPGVFALNERTALLGRWTHGFFSYTAVGAFNVGSIQLSFDKVFSTQCQLMFGAIPVNSMHFAQIVN